MTRIRAATADLVINGGKSDENNKMVDIGKSLLETSLPKANLIPNLSQNESPNKLEFLMNGVKFWDKESDGSLLDTVNQGKFVEKATSTVKD